MDVKLETAKMEDGMKKHQFMIVVLAMAVALMAAPAVAQTINLKADVPFDFASGKVMMKSGACTIRTITNGVVQVSDADRNSSATRLTANDLRSAQDAK